MEIKITRDGKNELIWMLFFECHYNRFRFLVDDSLRTSKNSIGNVEMVLGSLFGFI